MALGNILRLHPLHVNELPAHPALDIREATQGSANFSRPSLRSFVTHILDEAYDLSESTLPKVFALKTNKKSPPYEGSVEISSCAYSAAQIQNVNCKCLSRV